MNSYIAWGTTNLDLKIDATSYVFVSGFSEFLGTFIFIFLLVTILLNFNLKKMNGFSSVYKNGLISFSICVALFLSYLLSIGVNLGIMKNLTSASDYMIVSANPLLFNPGFAIAYMIKGANYLHANFYVPILNGFVYIIFEFIGAFLGAFLAYYFYQPIIKQSNPTYQCLANCFYTSSKHTSYSYNFLHETINTFLFMVFILAGVFIFSNQQNVGINVLKQFLVCVALFIILIALGGVVGNALNPVRDFCPRLVLYILFRNSDVVQQWKKDWKYVSIPLVAPNLGCVLGVLVMPGFLY